MNGVVENGRKMMHADRLVLNDNLEKRETDFNLDDTDDHMAVNTFENMCVNVNDNNRYPSLPSAMSARLFIWRYTASLLSWASYGLSNIEYDRKSSTSISTPTISA